MEKFQIAKYGMMQVVALVYGVLASGTAVKLSQPILEMGYPMPTAYWGALCYRHYGMLLFIPIMVWVLTAGYYSSSIPEQTVDERWLIGSGMFLLIILFLLGTILAFVTGAFALSSHGPLQSL